MKLKDNKRLPLDRSIGPATAARQRRLAVSNLNSTPVRSHQHTYLRTSARKPLNSRIGKRRAEPAARVFWIARQMKLFARLRKTYDNSRPLCPALS